MEVYSGSLHGCKQTTNSNVYFAAEVGGGILNDRLHHPILDDSSHLLLVMNTLYLLMKPTMNLVEIS